MSALWTPPNRTDSRARPAVAREHELAVRQWEQQVLSMMHETGGILDYWNTELKKIDPMLRLMQATPLASAPGVKAGYYHLVRLRDSSEGTFMWVQPLHDMRGNFVEPTSQMLDALRWADLQSDRVISARQENDRREAASRERQSQREHDERVDEGVERFKAATRAHVSMTDTPWSAKNTGTAKRGRKSSD